MGAQQLNRRKSRSVVADVDSSPDKECSALAFALCMVSCTVHTQTSQVARFTGLPFLACHGGSCDVHVMVVHVFFSMSWWFMFFHVTVVHVMSMSWWFMFSFTCHVGSCFR